MDNNIVIVETTNSEKRNLKLMVASIVNCVVVIGK